MDDNKPALMRIPIKHVFPEDLISRYANNVVVQHTEKEFFISFFEALPPLVIGTPEERVALTEALEAVESKCVARIIISADMMPSFIKTLQDNLDRHSKFDKDLEGMTDE